MRKWSHHAWDVVTILATALFLAKSAQAGQPNLALGSAAGLAGDSVNLLLRFDPSTSGVASMQFDIMLPPGVSPGLVTPGWIATSANKTISSTLNGPGDWHFAVNGANQTTVELATGTLVTLQLAIAAGTPVGPLTVSISGVQFTDPNGASVAPGTVTGGKVNVIGSPPPLGSCQISNPAFCDTFDEGPSATGVRAGDLDPTKWTVGRLDPSDLSGFGPNANPVRIAPLPPCKSSFNVNSGYPPNDTLICDPTPSLRAQLMTAVAVQNYGNNSYMIQQPFDFANRTGKIVFDVDAVSADGLWSYVALDLTEDPQPAPTFQLFHNNETGPIPRTGLMMKWAYNCGTHGTAITMDNSSVVVYTNYIMSIVTPSLIATPGGNPGCIATQVGALNHFEIDLSQQHIDIYGSDFSPDNGQTFPNFHKLYSADFNNGTNVPLPFTRGYVHIAARNHATIKYGGGNDWVYHWKNIGFDGPVIANTLTYEVPDNTTMGTYDYGTDPIMNLAYTLRDATGGFTPGIYDPYNLRGPLQVQGVNKVGATTAQLSLNVKFNAPTAPADTTWGLSYRFNGKTWHTRFITPIEVELLNDTIPNNDPGIAGNLAMLIDVTASLPDIVNGPNTLDLLPVIPFAATGMPVGVGNIDLILTLGGPPPAPPAHPTGLRIR